MEDPRERRYTDEEVRRLLEDATEGSDVWSPSAAAGLPCPGPEDGPTLAELQDIGREVGIDPAALERAAARLDATGPVRVTSERGGPFSRVVAGELIITRPLGDPEIRFLLLEVERALERRGTIRMTEGVGEWRDPERSTSVRVGRGEGSTVVEVTMDPSADLVRDSALLGGFGLLGLTVVGMAAAPALLVAAPLAVGATVGLIRLHAVGRGAADRERTRSLLEHLREVLRLSRG